MPQNSTFLKAMVVFFIIFGKSTKILMALKVAKPALTFGSMALSTFAYAFWLGPWFAVGLIAMLFIHEMGHVIALRLKGYPAPVMVFVPFLGAAIFAPKFSERDTEAYVGYGGPLLGSLAAVVLFGIWFLLEENSVAARLVLITSYAAIFLNLFNMIPISPLDGGRITQAVGPWFQYLGVAVLLLFSIFFREPVILLIWVVVVAELKFIRPGLRATIAVSCTLGMSALMFLGYSTQPWWVDVIDVILASVLSLAIVAAVMSDNEDFLGADNRQELSVRLRIWWFTLYAALTGALVMVLVYQTSLLPPVPQ